MKKSLLFVVMALTVAACSKSNGYVYVDDDDEQMMAYMNVVADDGSVSLLVPKSTIGLFVIDENSLVTYREVVVDANGKILLPSGSDMGSLIIYSPAQPSWGADALQKQPTFIVKEDQSTEAAYTASDLLIGKRSAVKTRSDISLSCKHVLARMVVHIIDETGKAEFDHMTMRLLNMAGSVGVNLLEQTVTTYADGMLNVKMLAYNTTDRRISFEAIVAPQTKASTEAYLEFSIYGSHRLYHVPQISELESGKTFVYQMRYTSAGLIPDGTYISNWDDDGTDTFFNIKIHK